MSYLCYWCMFTQSGVKHVLNLIKAVTWYVSYKRQELLTLHGHPGLPPVFGGCMLLIFVFCVWVFFLLCSSSPCVLCAQWFFQCSLRFILIQLILYTMYLLLKEMKWSYNSNLFPLLCLQFVQWYIVIYIDIYEMCWNDRYNLWGWGKSRQESSS